MLSLFLLNVSYLKLLFKYHLNLAFWISKFAQNTLAIVLKHPVGLMFGTGAIFTLTPSIHLLGKNNTKVKSMNIKTEMAVTVNERKD